MYKLDGTATSQSNGLPHLAATRPRLRSTKPFQTTPLHPPHPITFPHPLPPPHSPLPTRHRQRASEQLQLESTGESSTTVYLAFFPFFSERGGMRSYSLWVKLRGKSSTGSTSNWNQHRRGHLGGARAAGATSPYSRYYLGPFDPRMRIRPSAACRPTRTGWRLVRDACYAWVMTHGLVGGAPGIQTSRRQRRARASVPDHAAG